MHPLDFREHLCLLEVVLEVAVLAVAVVVVELFLLGSHNTTWQLVLVLVPVLVL